MKTYGWFKKGLEEAQDSFEYKLENIELEIVERILAIMESKGINRAELARRLGVKKPTITRLFRDGSNMTLKRMLGIAEALDCDIKFQMENKNMIKKRVKKARKSQTIKRPLGLY